MHKIHLSLVLGLFLLSPALIGADSLAETVQDDPILKATPLSEAGTMVGEILVPLLGRMRGHPELIREAALVLGAIFHHNDTPASLAALGEIKNIFAAISALAECGRFPTELMKVEQALFEIIRDALLVSPGAASVEVLSAVQKIVTPHFKKMVYAQPDNALYFSGRGSNLMFIYSSILLQLNHLDPRSFAVENAIRSHYQSLDPAILKAGGEDLLRNFEKIMDGPLWHGPDPQLKEKLLRERFAFSFVEMGEQAEAMLGKAEYSERARLFLRTQLSDLRYMSALHKLRNGAQAR